MNNDQTLAEEATRKSEERHRTILRAAMDGFWLVNLEGHLLEVNDAYCRMSGYSEPELLAMSVADLSALESGEQAAAHIARIMERGQDRFETRHRRKDGSIIDIEVSAQYQPFEGGRIIVFLRDITERKQAEEALIESDSFIRTVMDNLPIGIAVNTVDPAVSFLYMNDNFPGFYRTSREALDSPVGFWSAVYEDPDFREKIRKRVLDDCASGDPDKMHWIDVPITRNGDETKYIEARNTIIPDKQLMVSTVWDVTARKQAELALLQQQELYEDLVNTLPAGVYRLRVTNRGNWQPETWRVKAKTQYSLDFASDRFCAILGVAYDTIAADLGLVSDFIHPDDKEGFDTKNAQAMTDFNTFIWEGRIISNQQTRWVHFESVPRAIDPETVLWTGIVYDITGLKLVEKEREQFFKFFQTSADLMCLADPDGCFMKTNPSFTETLGYSGAELKSKSIIEFIHPDDRQATLDEIARQKQTGFTRNFENRYLCRNGSEKWLSWRVNYSKDDGIAYATARDITEQKKLQEQLTHAHKMESVGRLAGGVAHDFNNMLSVIIGYTELARKKELDPLQLAEHLDQIQKAAEHSADIVRQLLAFARKQTVSPKVIDLNNTVDSMIKMLRRLIGEEIELVWHPEESLCPVKMDPTQINQILVNLCVNARDSITGVGRISIETGSKTLDAAFCAGHTDCVPGEYIQLTVSDNGSGMDKETLSKIFEPFFTTKEVGQGTGLGLAMVYGIVKQNAGFIDAQSEPGQGTSFTIYLPRYLGKEKKSRLENPVESAERGRETVLLVEDEPAILNLGRQLLEMQGYRVLAAATPGEAIRLAEEHIGEIHLLLTDVVMPEMNGRELAKKLLSFYPGLKRLFMSGHTADVIAHHGVLDEEVNFIQKPFSLDALAAKVREALGSKNGSRLNGL